MFRRHECLGTQSAPGTIPWGPHGGVDIGLPPSKHGVVGTVGKFQTVVQCKASANEVFGFLSSGAKTKMTVKSSDIVTMKVSLKNKMGFFSYGEIIECTVKSTDMGCRVELDGRPVLATNITADVKGAVMTVQDAIIREFGNR